MVTPAARAQRFGQWSWEGRLGFGQRNTENLSDGVQIAEFGERELELELALNGFLGHPSIGRFRLGVDLLLSEFEGSRVLDSEHLGYEADLQLFPRSRYPSRLFVRRRLSDYSLVNASDPLVASLPDTSTQWGGEVRLRAGILRGLRLGVEGVSYDFVAKQSDGQTQGRQWARWARSGGALQQSVNIEHQRRDFGVVGLEIEDVTLNVEERFQAESWRWQMVGIGILRNVVTAAAELGTDDFRLRNRFTFEVRGEDRLDLHVALGAIRLSDRATIADQGLSVFYRWRPRRSWEIAPFAQYARQASADLEFSAPRLGLAITFNRAGERWDTLFTARAGYGTVKRRVGDAERDEEETALGFTGSIGHGSAGGLRKELEVEVARNDLRLTRDPIFSLPGLGLTAQGVGIDDYYRGRFTLGHRWGVRSLRGWGEWDRRESAGQLRVGDFVSETLSANLEYADRVWSLQGNLGDTRARRVALGPENLWFAGVTLAVRPRRLLVLQASYRDDTRGFDLAPDLESRFLQVSLSYRIGAIEIEGRLFETVQRLAGQGERLGRGFRWTISRRARGLLPVVTGTERRGEIR